jgi:hypothetical protein
VSLPQDPTAKQLQLLRAGTVIDGVQVVPKVVKVLQSSQQPGPASGPAAGAGAGAAVKGGSAAVAGRSGGRSSRRSSIGGSGDGDGAERCILQLDVSEGKKHEVGSGCHSDLLPRAPFLAWH